MITEVRYMDYDSNGRPLINLVKLDTTWKIGLINKIIAFGANKVKVMSDDGRYAIIFNPVYIIGED